MRQIAFSVSRSDLVRARTFFARATVVFWRPKVKTAGPAADGGPRRGCAAGNRPLPLAGPRVAGQASPVAPVPLAAGPSRGSAVT